MEFRLKFLVLTRLSLAGLCVVAGTAVAQTASELKAELQKCRLIQEADKRVACYDALTPAPWGTPAGAAAVSVGTPNPTGGSTTPGAPVAAQAAAFGLPQATQREAVQEIQTHIVGRLLGWKSGDLFQLANRQVWQVVDGTEASYDLNNPKVRIKRGMMGSFIMEIEGVAITPRVRRVR